MNLLGFAIGYPKDGSIIDLEEHEGKQILDPKMVSFNTKLKTEMSQFILAQSITLTPGTVTVRIEKNQYLVHALTKTAADGLSSNMEGRVEKIFGIKA